MEEWQGTDITEQSTWAILQRPATAELRATKIAARPRRNWRAGLCATVPTGVPSQTGLGDAIRLLWPWTQASRKRGEQPCVPVSALAPTTEGALTAYSQREEGSCSAKRLAGLPAELMEPLLSSGADAAPYGL
jgi:hypothetical protein